VQVKAGKVVLTRRERNRALLLGASSVVIAWIVYTLMQSFFGGQFFEDVNNNVLENVFTTRAYRWRQNREAINKWADKIVVVVFDDETMRQKGFQEWPLPRARYAEMIERLDGAGAKAIGIDLLLDLPQKAHPGSDQALSRALARHKKVILADSVTVKKGRQILLEPHESLVSGWSKEERAARIGLTYESQADSDYVKSVPLVITVDGQERYAFDLLLAARMMGVPLSEIKDYSEGGFFEGNIVLGKTRVPVVNGVMTVNYFWGGSLSDTAATKDTENVHLEAHERINYLPMYALWELGDDLKDFVKDRIVLFGVTAQAGFDVKMTPMGRMAGVDIHANVILGLLSGEFLQFTPPWMVAAIMLACGLLLGLLVPRVPTYLGIGVAVVLATVLYSGVPYLLLYKNTVFEPALPILGLIVAFVTLTGYQILLEQRTKRRLSDLIKNVAPMPDKIVEEFISTKKKSLELGGEKVYCSILFSDVRGYTDMSERMDPQDIFNTLNAMYVECGNILHKHGGHIFDYIGDAQMVVFGLDTSRPADGHADDATRAGIEMVARMNELNEVWTREGKPLVEIGVGICTGEVTLGMMGSQQRQQFAAIGDTTNIAARLQAMSSTLGCKVIISDTTHAELKGHYEVEKVAGVKVKGKANLLTVYKVFTETAAPQKEVVTS